MKRIFTFLLIFVLSIITFGNKASKPQPDNQIYFFQKDNISNVIIGKFFLIVYYENSDMIVMITHELTYKYLMCRMMYRLSRFNSPVMYVEKNIADSLVKRTCRKDNIKLFDSALGLEFIFLIDKINYVMKKKVGTMIRMVNGFTCTLFIQSQFVLSGFEHKYFCTVCVPPRDYINILKWLEGLNGKGRRKKRP